MTVHIPVHTQRAGEKEFTDVLTFRVTDAPRSHTFEATLREDRGTESAFVLRCTRQISHSEKTWEVALSGEDGKSIHAGFSTLQLPLIPDYVCGLDGTTFEIIVENGFNSSHLQWWSALPSRWSALGPLLKRLLRLAGPDAAESVLFREESEPAEPER